MSQAIVEMAALSPALDVIDLACGTGNAALLAARRGARVVGMDASPRLLEVARERARIQGVDVDFREGDLLDLPVADGTADVVLSVFGVVFAPEPAQALREVGRVLRPGGRVLFSAWLPAGPIDGMLGAMGRILARVSQAHPPQRFNWADPAAVGPLATCTAPTSCTSSTTVDLEAQSRLLALPKAQAGRCLPESSWVVGQAASGPWGARRSSAARRLGRDG